MATAEERRSRLEGRVQEHSLGFQVLRDGLGRLEQRFDARFESLEQRMDGRFDGVDRRLDLVVTMLVGVLITILGGFVAAFLMQ